ncbi:MAG: hypothetical protein CVU23_09265 [Betaproteobacteria bacterium HGW-Betaproteobacteria-17]|nr:MAG: hypothetical protein CVU23_09265 [Betaproteobacteria bacterium HGW-Betaproteobacteria-17]
MKRIWSGIRRFGLLKTLLSATLVLFVAVLLVVGGAAGLAWTNTEAFCISCHEMKDNVYAEFKGTIHDTNRSGVRAVCSDCHVPRQPVDTIKRKFAASLELYHALRGTINTPEKFEARRFQMAVKVWTRMKKTDSIECRNCHHRDAMSPDLQSARAQRRHAKADEDGMTCIDCHFGIAHGEPTGDFGPRDIQVNHGAVTLPDPVAVRNASVEK